MPAGESVDAVPDPEPIFDRLGRTVTVERRKLVDEREAYERFASKLEGIGPAQPDGRAPLRMDVRPRSGLERAIAAYRDTVMAVPHYTDDYDESLRVHLGEEFGTELAVGLTEGNSLSPPLKASLSHAAEEAANRRDVLIDTIDRELERLQHFREPLEDMHDQLTTLGGREPDLDTFDSLHAARDRLIGLRKTCEELVAERQSHLRALTRATPADIEDFGRYLYGREGPIHPVITHLTAVLGIIEEMLSRIERQLMVVQ